MSTPLINDRSRREFLKASLSGGAFIAQTNLLPSLFGSRWLSSLVTEHDHGSEQSMNGKLSAAALQQMHNVMSGYVTRSEVPGLVTLVARGDDVYVNALGTSVIDEPKAHPCAATRFFVSHR